MIKSKNQVALFILAVPIVIFFLIWWNQETQPKPKSDFDTVIVKINSFDATKGNNEAMMELIEYSDFQCPACGYYYPFIKNITQEFSGQLLFSYRHFPLSQHLNANIAARAAESAGKQNKFWEMHDLIFENQNSWSNNKQVRELLIGYAEIIGLDINKFNTDIDSQEIKDKVSSDYKGGVKIGINSTPTFFLNGKKLDPNETNPQILKEKIHALVQAQ